MFQCRKDIVTFDKIQASIQEITKRDFTLQTLASLLTVMPAAYQLRYELRLQSSHDNMPLIITCPDSRMSPTHLLIRRKTFRANLLKMAKEHHGYFLESLDPPMDVDSAKLSRWHPKFRLDKVPPVHPNMTLLPKKPVIKNQAETADDILKSVAPPSPFKSPKKITPPDSPKKITQGALKGLSFSLLEKIRAKEAHKLAQELTRNPEVEHELKIIDRLPRLMRTLHVLCVAERKTVIPYKSLIEQLEQSLEGHDSRQQIEEHVKYLITALPGWIMKLSVSKGDFIKIDKHQELSLLQERLDLHKRNLLAATGEK